MAVTFGLGLKGWIGVCQPKGAEGIQEAEERLKKVLKWVSDIFGSLDFNVCRFLYYKALFLSVIFQHPQTTPGPTS